MRNAINNKVNLSLVEKEIAEPNETKSTYANEKLGVWKPAQAGFVCVAAVLTAQLMVKVSVTPVIVSQQKITDQYYLCATDLKLSVTLLIPQGDYKSSRCTPESCMREWLSFLFGD